MVTKLLTLKSRAYLKAEILTRSSPLFQENEKPDMVATLEVIYQQKLEVMYLRSVTFIPPLPPSVLTELWVCKDSRKYVWAYCGSGERKRTCVF